MKIQDVHGEARRGETRPDFVNRYDRNIEDLLTALKPHFRESFLRNKVKLEV